MSIWEAASNLVGGWINSAAVDRTNDMKERANALEAARQREFAQSGISWKVEDAKRAGIHPLYAIGAQTTSYAPQTIGYEADTSLGNAVAKSGADISRAMDATRTTEQRAEAAVTSKLSLERAGLENELLRTQIAKMRGQVGPPMPALNDRDAIPGQPATRTINIPGIGDVSAIPSESTQDAVSKEYGDEGLPQIPGQYRFARDAYKAWAKQAARENSEAYGGYWDVRQKLNRYWDAINGRFPKYSNQVRQR